MDMGITKGARVRVRKVAPLGDPIEITVRGYELSIRRADSEIIEVGDPIREEPASPGFTAAIQERREVKIALAGNPNCGKTSLFNVLTGSSQTVGNWPGVTVEKKDGRLRKHQKAIVQDLPGIYSLSPFSMEEGVARSYLVDDAPDAILDIVDGTNIERNLYLTTQLMELGIPTVVAINMIDLVRKNGDEVDLETLSGLLHCPVVGVSALHEEGIDEVARLAVSAARSTRDFEAPHVFKGSVEHAIAHIEESIDGMVPERSLRWYAIKVFERDPEVLKKLSLPDELRAHLEKHIADCEAEMDDDSGSIIVDQRYAYIKDLVAASIKRAHPAGTLTFSEKIDLVVTNRILALPIFVLVIWFMYYVSVTTVGAWATDWANNCLFGHGWSMFGVHVPGIPELATALLAQIGAASWVESLVVDGMIGGVGTVLGFVPQIMLVFFFLSFLEDCGYMARIAFIMDRLFRHFGLSGKSFIPMLVGTGCTVPALMASRTIESIRDRRMTMLLTPFIPCSAKLEVIGLITLAFFPGSMWIAPSMYFFGIALVVLSGIALKKSRWFLGDPAPFVMELPAYHLPTARSIFIHMWERARAFIVKASTVIFSACVIVWFLQAFTWRFTFAHDVNDSILATLGGLIAWIFVPLGFGDWRGAVTVLSAGIAKEQATGTLGVLAHVAQEGGTVNTLEAVREMFTAFNPEFAALAAFSFLILNLFNPPCVVAIYTAMREMGSRAWGWAAFGFQFVVGYTFAFVTYQLGKVVLHGAPFGPGAILSSLFLLAAAYFVLRPARKVK